jgi:AcrR family transcriptional regulator
MGTNKSKKEHILNIASDLFNKQGIRATGVDQVVAESQIAKMTLYNHYESKDELVLAYLLRQDEKWRTWFSFSVNKLSITPKGKLLAIFDVLGQWFQEPDFNGCAFIKTASEFADHSHPYNEAAQKYKSYLKDFIKDLVHQSNVKNEEDLANGIYLLVEGAITIAMLQSDQSVALHARKIAEVLIERLI